MGQQSKDLIFDKDKEMNKLIKMKNGTYKHPIVLLTSKKILAEKGKQILRNYMRTNRPEKQRELKQLFSKNSTKSKTCK